MVNVLTDALLNAEYFEVLSGEDKVKLTERTLSIAEKCHIAGKEVGLSEDSSISYQTYKTVQDSLKRKRGSSPDYIGLCKRTLGLI